MVSGLFGVYRQSGYALGFAITASLFTPFRIGLMSIGHMTHLMQQLSNQQIQSLRSMNQGSQWSPEVLGLYFDIGILLCSSILIITFVNSIPKVKLMFSKQMTTALMAVVVSIISMASYSLNAPGVIDSLQLNEINRPVVSVSIWYVFKRI